MLLEAATESVAESVAARADEISFAPSGALAAHAAVLGTIRGNARGVRPRFTHSAVEHSSILHAGEFAAVESVSVGVDRFARVDADAFVSAARGAAAAALQAGNHEVGTRQPVARVAEALGDVPLIVDVSQAIGHEAPPEGWSVLTADARVWGAGPGAGVLAVRTGTRRSPPFPADDRGRLPGAPDLPAIVAAAASLRAARASAAQDALRMRRQIDRIRAAVALIDDVDVLGDPVDRFPHIATFSCLYVDGEAVLTALDREGFAVSSGSSCTSSTLEPSHVLVAMGALTSGNVRVSVHPGTTDADVEKFLAVLPGVVADVRAELGASGL